MAIDKKKKIILLDMHAILHRAYHALPDFTSSTGEPTGALYGLSTMLLSLIEEFKPEYIAACFDLPKPTFRKQVYDGYKAGRVKTDDALIAQIERSRDILNAFNIPYFEMEGYEADDLLGTISEEMKQHKDTDVIIASGDMDTLQLVDDKRVQVYTLKRGIKDTILYDEEGVKERFGFGPEYLPDYKGLRGDPSDNIIGVKGIGEKTATTLITTYGSIEEIYQILEKDKDAFIKTEGISLRIAGLLEENKEEALFSKMLASIRKDAPINFTLPKETWREALEGESVISIFNELGFKSLIPRFKNAFKDKFENSQISLFNDHKEKEIVVDEEDIRKVALALWLIDSDKTHADLEDIFEYAQTRDFSNAKKSIFSDLEEKGLKEVYETIELPLLPIISDMRKRGIKLDCKYLKQVSKKYQEKLSKIEKNIWKYAGREFNINSPKQLGEILFDTLGLKVSGIKKTSTGQRSTREEELEKLQGEHPIIEEILQYRELQKLLSTYINVLPNLVGEDGRLHAEFLQDGTTTGRISSQNPNLQNIPIKSEQGRAIRHAFISEEGCVLASFDYSQIELRIAAMLSGDEKLLSIFKEGRDIHGSVASEIFKVSLEEVTKVQRSRAKSINFGILYGMGVNALRKNLGDNVSQVEAKRYLEDYFASFPALTSWIEETKKFARKNGYTETFFGRKRYFPTIRSRVPYIAAAAERMAVNAPIQGTQADIIKLAMIEVCNWVQEDNLSDSVHLLLQIHDELVYEIREDLVSRVVPEIKRIMESIVTPDKTGGIMFSANASIGKNWGDMIEFKS